MVQRLRTANSAIWLAIIFLGCVGTLSQVIFDNNKMALLFAFASVCMWTFLVRAMQQHQQDDSAKSVYAMTAGSDL